MTLSIDLHDPAELGMSAARLADAAALMDRQHAEGLTPMAVAWWRTARWSGLTPSATRDRVDPR